MGPVVRTAIQSEGLPVQDLQISMKLPFQEVLAYQICSVGISVQFHQRRVLVNQLNQTTHRDIVTIADIKHQQVLQARLRVKPHAVVFSVTYPARRRIDLSVT